MKTYLIYVHKYTLQSIDESGEIQDAKDREGLREREREKGRM